MKKLETRAKFTCRWLKLNNKTKGFIGIGKERQKVKFLIGKSIPGTENRFTRIWQSKFIKQEIEDGDYDVPDAEFS